MGTQSVTETVEIIYRDGALFSRALLGSANNRVSDVEVEPRGNPLLGLPL
jgi:hypothetical protein